MKGNKNLYIQIYKIKSQLEKQLENIQIQLEDAMPEDFDERNQLANDIVFGKYDYPFSGLTTEKVLFVTKKLKRSTVAEMKKYMLMVGENEINQNHLERELKLALSLLVASNKVIEMGNGREDIKYELNK